MLDRLDESYRLTRAIAVRLEETLVDREFDVSSNRNIIRVTGVGAQYGNTFGIRPAIVWLLPGHSKVRLVKAVRQTCTALQRFVSRAERRHWPTSGAACHVRATDQALFVWWGDESERDAVVRLRPIPWQEWRGAGK